MPVWDLDEMKDCCYKLYSYLDNPMIESYFNILGGTLRSLLGMPSKTTVDDVEQRAKHKVAEALARTSAEKCMRNVGDVASEQDVSHVLIHIESHPPYSEMQIQYGSSYIAEQVFQTYEKAVVEDLIQFLTSSDGLGEYGSLRGTRFELYAHRKLLSGGKFRVRNLDDDTEAVQEIKRTSLNVIPGSTLEFPYDRKLYCQPKTKNFVAVDSWICGIGFFQMTVSVKHAIKMQGMSDLVKASNMDSLYFVVPQGEVFSKFKKQNFETTNNTIAKKFPKNLTNFKQYVLELPLVITASSTKSATPPATPPATKTTTKPTMKKVAKKRTRDSDEDDSVPPKKKQKKKGPCLHTCVDKTKCGHLCCKRV